MFRKMHTKQYLLMITFCMYYRCSNRILSCNWNQFVHICCQRYTTPRNCQSKYFVFVASIIIMLFFKTNKTGRHNSAKAISAGQFINKQRIEYPKLSPT